MRLHRFIVGLDLASGKVNIDDPAAVHQWSNVLRLREGDTVVLCDGKGREAEAVIHELGKTSATVLIGDVRAVESEPARRVTLCAAIIKRENFEWIVEKATEAGVSEILPIISARTMKTGLKMDRLRAIAKEAVEQCGRGVVPVIHEPMEFEEAMEKRKDGKNLFFHVEENVIPSSSPQASVSRDPSSSLRTDASIRPARSGATQHDKGNVVLWIGPEGGWTDEEVDYAKESGFVIGSLGTLVLRAETAATVATFLAANGLL